MEKGKDCAACKVVGVLVGFGALNWGLVGLFQLNLVTKLFGSTTPLVRTIYVVIGVAGLLKLLSLVKCCPCQGKGCEGKK